MDQTEDSNVSVSLPKVTSKAPSHSTGSPRALSKEMEEKRREKEKKEKAKDAGVEIQEERRDKDF